MRDRRHLMMTASLLSGVPLLMFSTLAFRTASDRFEDPPHLTEAAAAAIGEARSAGAGLRAPIHLSLAEEAYRRGLTERRRQELRVPLLRDFREARAVLAEAAHQAEMATHIAVRSVERERSAIDRAAEALAALDGVEALVWLDPDLRKRLQRARSLVSEASALLAGGAYRTGSLRANEGYREARAVAESLKKLTSRYTDHESLELWREWVSETVSWSARTGKAAIVVDKDAHRLTLYRKGTAVLTTRAELGWNNAADKRWRGDGGARIKGCVKREATYLCAEI